jgi:nitrite reductase/ring-hydroxylating ferredoxin subunit
VTKQPAATQPPYSQIVAAIEDLPGLENLSEWLVNALAPITRRQKLMDLLHGRLLGHALHPALSDLPLGMWSSVPVLDLVGDRRGATMLTAVGCVAAGATAATGTADWSVTYGRDRRLALVHGLANAGALALQLGSLGARLSGRTGRGRLLSVAGLAVGATAAYLGGDLVFDRALTVNHTASLSGPSEWTDVAADSDVTEGGLTAVDVDARKVLLTRVAGKVCALENTCTHSGGPLNEGTVEGGEVVCPWHGSRFRLSDGAVLGGPATFPQPQLTTRKVRGRIQIRGREG